MTHTHITSEPQWFRWDLRALWRYRDLTALFAQKALTVTYKQTILGPVWLVLNPLITSFVYMVLFGHIARLGTEGVPEMLFYLTGTAAWNFFSACFSNNSTIFVANAQLFGKVYFPRLTVPLSNLLTAAVRLGVQLLPALVLIVWYTSKGTIRPDGWFILLLPVTLVVSMLISALSCQLPIKRAVEIDPAIVLKGE